MKKLYPLSMSPLITSKNDWPVDWLPTSMQLNVVSPLIWTGTCSGGAVSKCRPLASDFATPPHRLLRISLCESLSGQFITWLAVSHRPMTMTTVPPSASQLAIMALIMTWSLGEILTLISQSHSDYIWTHPWALLTFCAVDFVCIGCHRRIH